MRISPRIRIAAVVAAGLTAVSVVPAHAATGSTTGNVTLRTEATSKSAALATIPKGTNLDVQCQKPGENVSGDVVTNYWAKVTYQGKTGYVTRAWVRIPQGSQVAECSSGQSTAPSAPSGQPEGVAINNGVNMRQFPEVNSNLLVTIPAGTKLRVQCRHRGDFVHNGDKSQWWAKVTYNGKTGYVTRAHFRWDLSGPLCKAEIGSYMSRPEMMERGQNWLNRRISYSQSNWVTEPGSNRKYRTDCSGFVSMVYRLNTSETTVTLYQKKIVREIPKNDLYQGDLIGNLNTSRGGNSGHVVVFLGWADNAKTQARVMEQAYPKGAQINTWKWGSQFYLHKAWRYPKLVNGA